MKEMLVYGGSTVHAKSEIDRSVETSILKHHRYSLERRQRDMYGLLPYEEEHYGVDAYRRSANKVVIELLTLAERYPGKVSRWIKETEGIWSLPA